MQPRELRHRRLGWSAQPSAYADGEYHPLAHRFLSGLVVLGLVASLVSGCTSAPTATPTLQPTSTPVPTSAPVPTATSNPTATPIPVAEWVEHGRKLLARSDFPGAEEVLLKAIAADAELAPAYTTLSSVYYWQAGREHDALAQALKAAELAPNNAEAHAAVALAQAGLLSPAQALAAAEQAVDLDATSAVAHVALARACLLDRQYSRAFASAEKALALDPSLAMGYHALAALYEDEGDFGRAYAATEQAIALEPEFVPWRVSLGHLRAAAEEYREALGEYEKALGLAPDYAEALLGVANAQVELRRYEEARVNIQRAAELAGQSPDPFVALGYLHLEQDLTEDALAEFRTALSREPDYWFAQLGMTDVYMRESECESLGQQAQAMTAQQPRLADGRVRLGWARLCSGDLNKSLEYFRKALELEPCNPSAHYSMALAYWAQGRSEESLEACSRALCCSPAESAVHIILGKLYAGQGKVDWAKAEYETALRLHADSLDAHVGLGEQLLIEEKTGEARLQADAAVALDSDDDNARRLLGMVLFLQGQAQESSTALEALLKDEPEDSYGHYYLGLAYRDLGRYSDAKKELSTFQALEPENSSAQMISGLVDALAKGYSLGASKATADMAEMFASLTDKEADIQVREVAEQGRVCRISFDVEAGQEQYEIAREMTMAVALAALRVPRIDPAVDGGVVVEAREKGEAAYSLSADLVDLTRYADGLSSVTTFVGKLRFSRAVGGWAMASGEEIQADLSELRELTLKKPLPAKSLTSAELEEYLREKTDASEREGLQADDAVLTLMGVLGPDDDLEQIVTSLYSEQLAGFYNHEEKAVFLVADSEQTAYDQMTLAHEYNHALQDQHFGLGKLNDAVGDDDQANALDALVEGDSTLAMLLYGNEHVGAFDMLQAYSGAGGLESSALDASPAFIREFQMFPYEAGLEFVATLYEAGGWEAVNAAYQNPPLSTEQILHPERYREGDKPAVVTLPDLPARLSAGWQAVDSEVMGELGIRLALAAHLGPGAASLAAEGWAGDRYVLLQQGAAEPAALVWQTYWDDQEEADQFFSLFREYMEHRPAYREKFKQLIGALDRRCWLSVDGAICARQRERYVTLVIGPDEATVEQMVAALDA